MASHVVFEDLWGDLITMPKGCLILCARNKGESEGYTVGSIHEDDLIHVSKDTYLRLSENIIDANDLSNLIKRLKET